ncbi:hypothetical protein VTN00DRAFT_8420 [Thermoascus crustaceus]|uniref:uncharacterized protein n=1 Tax=Thermoascus crustaceus TaxID=5088 RepID=UPI003743F99D
MKTLNRIFRSNGSGGKKVDDSEKLQFRVTERPVISVPFVPEQTSHAHASASPAVRRAKSQIMGNNLLHVAADWKVSSHGELHKMIIPPYYETPMPISTTSKLRALLQFGQEIHTSPYGSGTASHPTCPRPQSLSSNDWPWDDDMHTFRDTLHGCIIASMSACEIGQFLEKMCYGRDKPLDGLVTTMADDRYTYMDIGRTVLDCFGPRDAQDMPLHRRINLGDVDLRPGTVQSSTKKQGEQKEEEVVVVGGPSIQPQRRQRSPRSYGYEEPNPKERVRFLKGEFLDNFAKAETIFYPVPRRVVGIEGKAKLITIPPARGKQQQEQKARNARANRRYLSKSAPTDTCMKQFS